MAEQTGMKGAWGTLLTTDNPQDTYSITSGLDDIVFVGFNTKEKDGTKSQKVIGWYTGSGAITLSNYNGLPIGSVIIDMQAYKMHMKTAATTWKSSAASS